MEIDVNLTKIINGISQISEMDDGQQRKTKQQKNSRIYVENTIGNYTDDNCRNRITPSSPAIVKSYCCMAIGLNKTKTPQEIYFESRGKSCKKLLKFNGNSNKILLYPEESWARSAASSYWTLTPCWWQPNRCKIEEFTGSQRHTTKAKMLCLEKGSLIVMGSFKKKSPENDFKLYLTSNITSEDYNMGYCLTGFVERLCIQSNTFQMTHFAVIKRQWPSMNDSKSSKNKSKKI